MKKTICLLFICAWMCSCGDGTQQRKKEGLEQASEPENKPPDELAQKGLEVVAKNICLSCHQIDQPSLGPSYTAVAEKYAGREKEVTDTLANRIIKGSTGVWGSGVMTPNANLSIDEARAAVHYVLSLKK